MAIVNVILVHYILYVKDRISTFTYIMLDKVWVNKFTVHSSNKLRYNPLQGPWNNDYVFGKVVGRWESPAIKLESLENNQIKPGLWIRVVFTRIWIRTPRKNRIRIRPSRKNPDPDPTFEKNRIRIWPNFYL